MKVLIASLLAASWVVPAVAQQTVVINPPQTASRVPGQNQRVTLNITLVNPVAAGSIANDWSNDLAEANKSLYKIVNSECAVLIAALRGTCKLTQITTNGSVNDRNNFGNPQPGTAAVSASANATFELETAPVPAGPAPNR